MRPNVPTFTILLSLLAFSYRAEARADDPEAAATPAEPSAGQDDDAALPPAAVPDAKLVAPRGSVGQDPPIEEALASAADTPDEPVIAAEIEEESQELESLRKAEEAAKVRDAKGAKDRAAGAAQNLGLESPIKDRVDGALGRDGAPADATGRIALLPELDHDLARLQSEYDIPVEVNDAVVAYIRFFQSPVARGHFVKWLGRSYRYVDKYRAILRAEGLPEDTVFLAMIESGFANYAYSRARAMGPWQFIGATGKMFGLQQDFWVDERRDPEKSAHAAARYLKQLYQQTGDWRLAWAGYNAGVGRIYNAQRLGYSDFWEMAATPGRKVLRDETKGYVPKLMAAAIIYKHQEAFGFRAEEIERASWTDYDEVTIPQATLLSVLARAAGISEVQLIELNPELRRACTPPRPYKLKIPRTQVDVFAKNWPDLQGRVRMTFAGHVVRRGDTLSSVARRYGVPVQGVMEMNGLRTVRRLRVGQELIIPRPVGGTAVARAPEPVRRAEARPRVAVKTQSRPARTLRSAVRVRAGDTLWSISQRYGVDVSELCRWNGIKNPQRHKLLAGTRLVVSPERG